MEPIQPGRRGTAARPTSGGRTARALVVLLTFGVLVLTLMTACGDNGNGEGDTLLTGLSGLVILVLVVWLVARAVKKRR